MMEQGKNNRLDGLFKQAREEQPVMSVNEVKELLAGAAATDTHAAPAAKNLNTFFLAIAGLLVAGGAAWYFLAGNDSANSTAQQVIEKETTAVAASEPAVAPAQPVTNAVAENTAPATAPLVAPAPVMIAQKKAATPQKTVINGQYETTFTENGNKIHVILADDKVNELSINGELIPTEKYTDYTAYITKAKNAFSKKRLSEGTASATTGSKNGLNEELINILDTELRKDEILTDEAGYEFAIENGSLLINGKKQEAKFYSKYRDIIETKTNTKLGNAGEFRFRKKVS